MSQVLIYSLPVYRLVSNTAIRQERGGIVIENLYDNKDFAIQNLITKIKGEKNNLKIGKIVNGYIGYYKTIGENIDQESFNNISVLVDRIVNIPYVKKLIEEREEFEVFSLDIFNENEYSWGTFLPYLDRDITFEYEIPAFEQLIYQYRQNIQLIKTIEDENEKNSITIKNLSILSSINNIYNNISALYFTKVNKIIADIDGRPYKLSNYTSSLGFSKVDKDYQTLFKNSDPEIREILRRAQTIDKFKAK